MVERAGSLEALNEIFDATRLLFHRMRVAAGQVHGQGELSGARRNVLRNLASAGPQTVPQLARIRPVSRQHMQVVVNELLAEGLVEPLENPAHRRSPLFGLSAKGKSALDAMIRREERALGRLVLDVSDRDLRTAARALRRVREALESPEWRKKP